MARLKIALWNALYYLVGVVYIGVSFCLGLVAVSLADVRWGWVASVPVAVICLVTAFTLLDIVSKLTLRFTHPIGRDERGFAPGWDR